MKHSNDLLPCLAIRDELAALLYGELDGDDRARVEQHLAACGECRGELDGLARTKHALDAWSPPASSDAGREAREAVDAALRRSRVAHGQRSVLLGLAAAVLAFLGLSAFGAELDYRAGRVTIGFELPWIQRAELASADDASGHDWAERMHRIARSAADESLAAWNASQSGQIADWSQREEVERSRLVYAIDRARELDRESLASVLSTFQRGAAQEIQFTRAAITELAALVALEREH